MTLETKKIAVTGATGFIGRAIVESLLRRGASVVAVVRNPDKVPEFRAMGIEIRVADLADPLALAAGFRGADAVISNAALFRIMNSDWKQHLKDNVSGTENVIRAASDAGIGRVVHVSSVAVYRGQGRRIIDEGAPMLGLDDLGMFNAYSVSKAVSEQRAWELASELKISLSCSRPATVFGPFDPNFTPMIGRILARPVAPVPFGIRAGLVYVGDVAEGTVMILENDRSVGKSYNLTGPHDSSSEFFSAWRAAGGPWPRLPIPLFLPVKRLWDNTLAENELGWKNRTYAESLRETFDRDPWNC